MPEIKDTPRTPPIAHFTAFSYICKLIRELFMKSIVLVFAVFTGFLISSCSSVRYLSKSSAAELLSEELGFPVSSKDQHLPLYTEASHWIGVPYKYGGNTIAGIDCSGLVCNIYRKVYGKKLERTVVKMYKENCRKVSKKSLRPGDLVFFNTDKKTKSVNHVGIFLKDNVFIHASIHDGVRLNTLDETYYRKRWVHGGKVKR